VLIDPQTEEIRYVGWTAYPLRHRLRRHLWEGGRTHKVRWVQKLRRLKMKPRITLVQEVPATDWAEAECYWIGYFKLLGCDLTNGTEGGEGCPGHHLSEATRTLLSQKAKARWKDPEMRARYLKYGFQPGHIPTEEHRAALSEAQKRRWAEIDPIEAERIFAKLSRKVRGRTKTQEHRDKLSRALKGRPKSEETRAKMSRAHKGMRLTEEAKAKISAKMKGRPKTKEHVAKVRAALLARSKNHCEEPT